MNWPCVYKGGVLSLAIMIFVANDEKSVQQQLRGEMTEMDIESAG